MLNINLEALDSFISEMFGMLHEHARDDILRTAEGSEMLSKIQSFDSNIMKIHEGDEDVVGHVLSENDLQALHEYYRLKDEMDSLFNRTLLAYGFILGSNSGLHKIDLLRDTDKQ